MLSSLLFIGTTLKDGGSPPGGRRPLRQLPRPSSLPPARAGPVRRPPQALTVEQPQRSHPGQEQPGSRLHPGPRGRRSPGSAVETLAGHGAAAGETTARTAGGDRANHSSDGGGTAAAGMNHCGGGARAVPLRAGEGGAALLGSRGQSRSRSGRSMEKGLAGVTGIPPWMSPSFVGGKRGAKATEARAGLRSRDAPFRSVGRRLSGLGASSHSSVWSLRTRISAKYLSQTTAVFFPSNYSRLGLTQMFPWRWVSART